MSILEFNVQIVKKLVKYSNSCIRIIIMIQVHTPSFT